VSPWQIVSDTDGLLNILWTGSGPGAPFRLHNPTPTQEIQQFLNLVPHDHQGTVIIEGLGLGHVALALFRHRPAIRHLVVVELNPAILDLAKQNNPDLANLFAHPKVLVLTDADVPLEKALLPVEKAICLEPTCILRHAPSFAATPAFHAFDQKLYAYLNQRNVGGATALELGKEFLANRIANIPSLIHQQTCTALESLFSGIPAIIVAAGPSLDQAIPELRTIKENAVLIAVDSAVPSLLANGIVPHFLACLDASPVILEKFADYLPTLAAHKTAMLAMPQVASRVVRNAPSPYIFWNFGANRTDSWLQEILGTTDPGYEALTVSHLGVLAARRMGCSPILFVGLDLAYDGLKTHAEHTILDHQDFLATRIEEHDNDLIRVAANDGGTTLTDRGLYGAKKQLEALIRELGGTYINTSAKGAKIEGAPFVPLRKGIAGLGATTIDIPARIDKAAAAASQWDTARIVHRMQRWQERAARIQPLGPRIAALIAASRQELAGHRQGACRCFQDLSPRLQQLCSELDSLTTKMEKDRELWRLLQELTLPGLKESERLHQELTALAGDPDRYLAWLELHLRYYEVLNEARLDALGFFLDQITASIEFLVQEDKLTSAGPGQQTTGDISSLAALARHYMRHGHHALARPLVETLLRHFPDDAETLYWHGTILLHQRATSLAEETFRRAVTADSRLKNDIHAIHDHLAQDFVTGAAEIERQDRHIAVRLLLKGLALCPDSGVLAEAVIRRAIDDLRQIARHAADGNLTADTALLTEWHHHIATSSELQNLLDPRQCAYIHYYYAKMLLSEQRHTDAQRWLREAIRLAPATPVFHAEMAAIAFDQRDFSQAIAHLDEAVRLDRSYARHWNAIGDILFNAGQYDDAALAYQKFLKALPEETAVLHRLAECYHRQGNIPALEAVVRHAFLPSTDLLRTMRENFLLASAELENNPQHQSPHWRRFNANFAPMLDQPDLWPFFRRNTISQGMDDANPHAAAPLPPNLHNDLRHFFLEFQSVADDTLVRMAEEPLVGMPAAVHLIEGRRLSIASLDFAYFAFRLWSALQHRRHEPLTFLEIGGGFGGLARLLKELFPQAHILLLDLPEANAIATYYLHTLFPEARFHLFTDHVQDATLEKDLPDFSILPGWRITDLPDASIDCIINTRSMQEMTKDTIAFYLEQIQRIVKPDGLFYCVNRYAKQVGQETIILADYPFDAQWEALISRPKWKQSHIQELLLRRRTDANHAFQELLTQLPRTANLMIP